MRRIRLLTVSVLLALLLSAAPKMALAQNTHTNLTVPSALSTTPCTSKVAPEELKALAALIVRDELTEEARTCYWALSDESKAQLFEAVAVERGISVAQLHEETLKNVEAMKRRTLDSTLLGFWQQLIERALFSWGYRVVSVSSWWGDSLCDGDPSDQDYLFYYTTPTPVTNPDVLRAFSSDVLVDAMLVWYQLWYGGVNGSGVTEYNFAKICLGDTGVAMAGGAGRVAAYMKLLQP